jgi:glutathione S-transferase
MKLYYIAGACSLSPHIALREAALPFDLVRVEPKSHTLADGTDYYSIQPLGYVPLLELDDGTRLSEGPAIVQYIADRRPEKKLAPPNGTLARYQLQSWLGFVSTELHKGLVPLFNPAMAEETKNGIRRKLASTFGWLDGQLAGKAHVMGDGFTVADGYLFYVTMPYRAERAGVDLSPYAHLRAFRQRVAARPAVKEALAAEGLAPD